MTPAKAVSRGVLSKKKGMVTQNESKTIRKEDLREMQNH